MKNKFNDRIMKHGLINDILCAVIPGPTIDLRARPHNAGRQGERVGGFYLAYDETLADENGNSNGGDRNRKDGGNSGNSVSGNNDTISSGVSRSRIGSRNGKWR